MKTAKSEGIGHAYSGHESAGITTGDGAYLAEQAGLEVLDESEQSAFEMLYHDSNIVDWKAKREAYRARTGRSFPRAYKIVMRLEAVELDDEEARAYWQAKSERWGLRKNAAKRDIAKG